VAVDKSESAKYLRFSAESKNQSVRLDYRRALELGFGILVDLAAEVAWFEWAAGLGNSHGQCNYGVCLEFGLGVPANVTEAAKYYKLSADQNNPIGQSNYGYCLATERGVSQNLSAALRFLRLSAAVGHSMAKVKLDEYCDLEDRLISEWIKDFRTMREIVVLGKGGFGVGMLVEDAPAGERIAVKHLHDPGNPDHDFGVRFVREIEMLIHLRHPCVLSIVGYLLPTEASRAQIGTEFAVNGSLRSALDKLRSGSSPDFMNDTGIAIIRGGLAHEMKFIYSTGVIHRNLKPENVLLDERGWVRIGDLGICRFVDMKVTQTKLVGTPLYMAPEMYHEGEYTAAVDVYSFGLILYEFLAGGPCSL
jgi:TPR repeat protein